MENLDSIRLKIADMAALAFTMWQAAHRAFLEHDLDLLTRVLTDEQKLNNLEKEITSELVAFGRAVTDKSEKAKTLIFADIVGDLELIGDYCKDILERVQIKIEEKLLFSDEAVKEYEVLYQKTEKALHEVVYALKQDNPDLVGQVLKNQEHIDTLVDEYRLRHNQRMLDGVCSPMACNMFLNILDFTAAVYYHAKKVARNLLKIKK
ncbi:MAG: Na/Pi cotransporter family protein [Candidatus Omnitrophica bacterium]|nr:Na/Pi cotransporter family protein [Candidatus Omnitrophota bacterium]